jgi:hypothetical protein
VAIVNRPEIDLAVRYYRTESWIVAVLHRFLDVAV